MLSEYMVSGEERGVLVDRRLVKGGLFRGGWTQDLGSFPVGGPRSHVICHDLRFFNRAGARVKLISCCVVEQQVRMCLLQMPPSVGSNQSSSYP